MTNDGNNHNNNDDENDDWSMHLAGSALSRSCWCAGQIHDVIRQLVGGNERPLHSLILWSYT